MSDGRQDTPAEAAAQATASSELTPWTAPTLERMPLNEAMAGVINPGADLGCS